MNSGPGPLAAGGDEVAAHLGHELVLGGHDPEQGLLHPGPVARHPGELVQRALSDHGANGRGRPVRCRKQGSRLTLAPDRADAPPAV